MGWGPTPVRNMIVNSSLQYPACSRSSTSAGCNARRVRQSQTVTVTNSMCVHVYEKCTSARTQCDHTISVKHVVNIAVCTYVYMLTCMCTCARGRPNKLPHTPHVRRVCTWHHTLARSPWAVWWRTTREQGTKSVACVAPLCVCPTHVWADARTVGEPLRTHRT